MVNRIACFLTCGYTEAGAMQSFFRKINHRYEFKQFLPNKTIKKKGMSKNISSDISGLTGDGLLEKIYEILDKHKNEINNCKAIIIEDDLDGRFFDWSDDMIQSYKQSIINNVHSILNNNLPVFLLYASPEIESWFLTDWDNGFGYIYSDNRFIPDLDTNVCLFFTHHLRQYIFQTILKNHSLNIEDYGFFDGKYYKLSDQLRSAVQSDVKQYIKTLSSCNEIYRQQILHSRHLFYSKKLHGDIMLRNINPNTISASCKKHFSCFYYSLVIF